MIKEGVHRIFWASLVLVSVALCTGSNVRADVAPGDVIDKTNWQKAEGLLPDSVLNWVKKGDFVLNIGELSYDEKEYFTTSMLKSFEANKGKCDINEKDVIVDATTGKSPDYIEGIPFPDVDLTDPKAGQKLLYNKHYHNFSFGDIVYPAIVRWVGRGGFERELTALYICTPMDGYPPHRSYPNPDGIQQYNIYPVIEPYDISGFAMMLWRYRDERQDMNLAYIPAIRRIRRMSPANRSDSFVGSDFNVDDAWGYQGKIRAFEWKVVRSQEALIPYATEKIERLVQTPRGEWSTAPDIKQIRFGYETDGWQGAPWAPVNIIWVKKPVVVIDAVSKDKYYNYGRQQIWFDPRIFSPRIKVIYDRANKYWKTMLILYGGAESKDGALKLINIGLQYMVNERTQHASMCIGPTKDLPNMSFGDTDLNDYTLAGFQKYCK